MGWSLVQRRPTVCNLETPEKWGQSSILDYKGLRMNDAYMSSIALSQDNYE
jgi:hypothetical protein